MMKNAYTVEVYKKDGRTKKGERLILKTDYKNKSRKKLESMCKKEYPEAEGFRFVICDTYVERRNILNGQKFMERYDTPYYCSPSSETYWSM